MNVRVIPAGRLAICLLQSGPSHATAWGTSDSNPETCPWESISALNCKVAALIGALSDEIGGDECVRVRSNPWWSKAYPCGNADLAVNYCKSNLTCIFNAADDHRR